VVDGEAAWAPRFAHRPRPAAQGAGARTRADRPWSLDPPERLASERWSSREPTSAGGLAAYYRTEAALAEGDAMLALASRGGLVVRRLALRRTEPHLQVHLDLPALGAPAGDYFEALRALGERVGRARVAPG
jgi:hypothetical protein